MATTGNPWLPLVVDEGQPAQADGVFVHVQERPCLVARDGCLVTSGMGVTAATMAVPLRFDGPVAEASALEWRYVRAVGVLHDGHLVISSSDGLTIDDQADDQFLNARNFIGAVVNHSGRRDSFARRIPSERILMDRGLLLDAWTDEGTGRRFALATDVGQVRSVLSTHYGEKLYVIESRWDRDYLDRVRAAVDERVILASGTAINASLQMQVALTLLHLPSAVAVSLDQFSRDALSIRVLMSPAPRRSA